MGCREVLLTRKDVYTVWGFKCKWLGEQDRHAEISAIELMGVMGTTNALREAVGSPDNARVGDLIMAVNNVEDTVAMKEALAKTGRIMILRLKESGQRSAEASSQGGKEEEHGGKMT
jgi:hypothetical protein